MSDTVMMRADVQFEGQHLTRLRSATQHEVLDVKVTYCERIC